jgi:uncharacterized membrane protein
VLLEYRTSTKLSGFLKAVGLLALQLGLLLTFSRSGIVAILAIVGLYIVIKTLMWIMKPTQLETASDFKYSVNWDCRHPVAIFNSA